MRSHRRRHRCYQVGHRHFHRCRASHLRRQTSHHRHRPRCRTIHSLGRRRASRPHYRLGMSRSPRSHLRMLTRARTHAYEAAGVVGLAVLGHCARGWAQAIGGRAGALRPPWSAEPLPAEFPSAPTPPEVCVPPRPPLVSLLEMDANCWSPQKLESEPRPPTSPPPPPPEYCDSCPPPPPPPATASMLVWSSDPEGVMRMAE